MKWSKLWTEFFEFLTKMLEIWTKMFQVSIEMLEIFTEMLEISIDFFMISKKRYSIFLGLSWGYYAEFPRSKKVLGPLNSPASTKVSFYPRHKIIRFDQHKCEVLSTKMCDKKGPSGENQKIRQAGVDTIL